MPRADTITLASLGGAVSKKSERKPKLSDNERHRRFIAMAKEVGASDKAEDFEKAFKKVVPLKIPKKPR